MQTKPLGDSPALNRALATLAALGVVPRVGVALGRKTEQIGPLLREAVLAEVSAFSASGNPDVLPDLERHGGEQIGELCRLLGGGGVNGFAFVRTHAHRRAEQHFPLEATLHAYRCGHKVLSHWIRHAATRLRPRNLEPVVTAVADFAIEYTNAISTIAAAEYVAHTRALAEAAGDRRTELLNILVSGYDESDGRVARMLKRAGYLDQRQSFCVALAQSVDPLEMENPARAQRIVDAIVHAMGAVPIRTLVGIRNNVITAVFSDARRVSGWTAPRANLADRIEPLLLALGPAVLIGISNDHPSTAFIPRGVHEATVALDFSSVNARVVQFSNLPIRRLLVHRGTEYVQSSLPVWFGRLKEADAKAHGALVGTLRALADADMNVQQAARVLAVHANTIYARLQRIAELTGLQGQRYHHLTELLLAADCAGL